MATKKYMSLERLQEYDTLIKQEIADSVSGKANSSHTHDDRYYTESEIDSKLTAVNSSITNITSGTTIVKKAEYATTAGSATTADSADEATHATTADSATTAASCTGNAATATKATQDGNGKVISSTYETKADATAKLTEAKNYADSAAATVKNDLLNGAGTAYDTLKELGDLIDSNVDAIEALETVAAGKADASHTHAIADVSGLQSALDGKAAASHGTHVSFDSTNKPKMDGTAAFGTSSKVARADHVHPTDTSRASKTDFDTHVADTTKHITSTERTNWGTAYTHSQVAHAPSNAEKNQNAFSNIAVSGQTTVAADSATDTLTLVAGTNVTITTDATNDKVTISATDTNTTYSAGTGIFLSGTTFSNSGVRAISTGTSNGTISVDTNGTSADVAVKGLGSAAYTASTAYDAAGSANTALESAKAYTDEVASGKAASSHSHGDATTSAAGFMTATMVAKLNGIATGANKTTVDSSLSSSSTNPVQNKVVNSAITSLTSTVSANTSSISAHSTSISALQTAVAEFEEITSDDITALFAQD